MDGTVSNDELARRIADLTDMLREDIAEIKASHASFVLREVYEARHTAMRRELEAQDTRNAKDLEDLRTELKLERDQRRTLSRWVWGTLVVPVILFIGQVVINAQGGAG